MGAVAGFRGSGVYRVSVVGDDEAATFVVAHDADVAIGPNRVGSDGPGVGGRRADRGVGRRAEPGSDELPLTWRHFHVFLPYVRALPLPDPRQRRVQHRPLPSARPRLAGERATTTAHLVREAARLVGAELLPILQACTGTEAVLAALDRGDQPLGEAATAADLLHAAIADELARSRCSPTEAGPELTLAEAVLPAAVARRGRRWPFRDVLGEAAEWEGRRFPAARFCAGRWARSPPITGRAS